MNCPSCGADVTPQANFCSNCGGAIDDASGQVTTSALDRPCRECGVPVPAGSNFCGSCGATSPHGTAADEAPPVAERLTTAKPKRDDDLTVPRGKVTPGTGTVVRDVRAGRGSGRRPAPGTEDAKTIEMTTRAALRDRGEDAKTIEMSSRARPGTAKKDVPTLAKLDLEKAPASVRAPRPTQAKPSAPTPVATRPATSKPLVAPPPKAGPETAASSLPDITDEIDEIRFMRLQGQDDEAADALTELAAKHPGHPDLATLDVGASSSKPAASGRIAPETSKEPAPPATDDADESSPTALLVFDEETDAEVGAPPSRAHADELPTDEVLVEAPADEEDTDSVGESGSWGNAPAPGGTVIARAPTSPDAPNADPLGAARSRRDDPTSLAGELPVSEPSDAAPPPQPSVGARPVRGTGALRLPTDRTIVTRGLQSPAPFEEDVVEAKAGPGPDGPLGEWLEGNALDLVATPRRKAGPSTTMVPTDPDRPSRPAPFAGETPPGSTMVSGTTPPVGGFPTIERPSAAPEFERVDADAPLPASDPEIEVVIDDDDEPTTGTPPMGSPIETPAAPTPVATTGTPPAPVAIPEPAESGSSFTTEGTVMVANPLPPAKVPRPIEPVRLVMLGSRGQPVAERTLAAGDTLLVGRDPGEPWGDDEYLEENHARITPAPGGGVMVDDFDGTGPVYRQVEHRRHVRLEDQFRVGQSVVTYLDEGAGPLLTVRAPADTTERVYPLPAEGLMLGREEGDIVFPEDTYVSSAHARFSWEGRDLFIEDLGSSNGTYVRVRTDEPIEYGALLLIGHTQFRIQALPG